MVDEPQNDETSEAQEETTQDEGAPAAGPVAEEGTPSSRGGRGTHLHASRGEAPEDRAGRGASRGAR